MGACVGVGVGGGAGAVGEGVGAGGVGAGGVGAGGVGAGGVGAGGVGAGGAGAGGAGAGGAGAGAAALSSCAAGAAPAAANAAVPPNSPATVLRAPSAALGAASVRPSIVIGDRSASGGGIGSVPMCTSLPWSGARSLVCCGASSSAAASTAAGAPEGSAQGPGSRPGAGSGLGSAVAAELMAGSSAGFWPASALRVARTQFGASSRAAIDSCSSPARKRAQPLGGLGFWGAGADIQLMVVGGYLNCNG